MEVMPTYVGIEKAKALGLDLVVVAPTAQPPVAKIIDHGEYEYQEKKRKGDAKRKQHRIEVKEVKFRPNTDTHDYEFKKNHARRFLQEGNKVKGTGIRSAFVVRKPTLISIPMVSVTIFNIFVTSITLRPLKF